MKSKITFKKYKKNKSSLKLGIIILFILFLVFFMFSWFSKEASPKMIHLAQLNLEKYIAHVTSDFKILLEKNYSDQFLNITENKNGEITSIDYNMAKIYEMAEEFTNSLEQNLNEFKSSNPYVKEEMLMDDTIILFYPIGVVSDSIFLSNLGPKIPIAIQFMDSIFSSVKTRAKDYGINNALLEVYLEVNIHYEILTPVTFEENIFTYELLLDTKVIEGSVPNLYSDYLETRSAFFDISFPSFL